MFQNISFEFLLKRMMDRVVEKYPNTDTREGSIIYNALAPAAVELQNVYLELDYILKQAFADTCDRDSLIKLSSERGITPYQTTYAILKAVFNCDVPIGSRFSLDKLNYIVTERISEGVYKVQCETIGEIGNEFMGKIIPIDYINGLQAAEITEILIPAEDEEETEHLRQRYIASFNGQAFGGNRVDYKEKVTAIEGVGGVKIYRAWNGGGTVKLVIINSQFDVPSSVLIDKVQTTIDPTVNQGDGDGLAPIDHVVTVFGVGEVDVDVKLTITYKDGWLWQDIESNAHEVIDGYFTELSKSWADSDSIVIRISQIEQRILHLSGVVDIENTEINGQAQNFIVDTNSIPKRGDVSG